MSAQQLFRNYLKETFSNGVIKDYEKLCFTLIDKLARVSTVSTNGSLTVMPSERKSDDG